ncbi:hypothetical protein RQP46_006518 [Phenoliferia psychrophenolica]
MEVSMGREAPAAPAAAHEPVASTSTSAHLPPGGAWPASSPFQPHTRYDTLGATPAAYYYSDQTQTPRSAATSSSPSLPDQNTDETAAMNLFNSSKSKSRGGTPMAAPVSSSPPPSATSSSPTRRLPTSLLRPFAHKPIPHSPGSLALHTPPVLLPLQPTSSTSPRWSPSASYESDSQSSVGVLSSGTDDASDDEEWAGVDLAAEEDAVRRSTFLQRTVNFGELLDGGGQTKIEKEGDEAEVLESPVLLLDSNPSGSDEGGRPQSVGIGSPRKRENSEEEPGAWWTSSGSLASLANGGEEDQERTMVLEPRPSKVGLAIDYDASDGESSSASSVYSRSSGIASPQVNDQRLADAPPSHARMASLSSVGEVSSPSIASSIDASDYSPPPISPSVVESLPTFAPVVAPSPPHSLHDSPLSDVGSPNRQGKRREAKPERKAPPLKQKSLHRPPGAGKRLASADSSPAMPSADGESSHQPTLTIEIAQPPSEDQYVEGSRLASRPRDSTPLSASDFGDIYSHFSHSPSLYDAELPSLHHTPPPPAPAIALVSPPLPPLPFETPDVGTDEFSTPSLEDEDEDRFPTAPRPHLLAGPTAREINRLSEAFSDVSGDYHDASMSRTSSSEGPSSPLKVLTFPQNLCIPPATEGALDDQSDAALPSPTSSTSREDEAARPSAAVSKADARTRALAFVADLKRAKLAAQESRPPSPHASPPLSPIAPIPTLSSKPTTVVIHHARTPSLPTSASPPFHHSPPPTLAASPEKMAELPLPEQPTSPTPTFRSDLSHAEAEAAHMRALDRLTRNRPLPECARFREIRSLRSAGERGHAYALKINALAKEDTGTHAWITFVRGSQYGHAERGFSPNGTPNKSRAQRVDASSASSVFPIRGGDSSYRAKELSVGSFTSRDLQPSVPYPGVLHLARSGKPSSSSASSIKSSSFFSLGRKSSSARRTSDAPTRSSSGSHASSPLGILSSAPSPAGTIGRTSLSGPRMPYGGGSIYAKSIRSSTISLVPNQSPSLQQQENDGRLSVDGEALERLTNVLPNAERGTLAAYLLQAGNDDTLAISLYLAAQQLGHA